MNFTKVFKDPDFKKAVVQTGTTVAVVNAIPVAMAASASGVTIAGVGNTVRSSINLVQGKVYYYAQEINKAAKYISDTFGGAPAQTLPGGIKTWYDNR